MFDGLNEIRGSGVTKYLSHAVDINFEKKVKLVLANLAIDRFT